MTEHERRFISEASYNRSHPDYNWKEVCLKAEKRIADMTDLLQKAADIIEPALEILPETYDEEIDAYLKARRIFEETYAES